MLEITILEGALLMDARPDVDILEFEDAGRGLTV